METKPKTRRTKIKEPSNTYAVVLLDSQVAGIDRIADARRRSRSEIVRDALTLFLRVNSDSVSSDGTEESAA